MLMQVEALTNFSKPRWIFKS